MKSVKAWGVTHNGRGTFWCGRWSFDPEKEGDDRYSDFEDDRLPSGRRKVFRSRQAAQTRADELNARAKQETTDG